MGGSAMAAVSAVLIGAAFATGKGVHTHLCDNGADPVGGIEVPCHQQPGDMDQGFDLRADMVSKMVVDIAGSFKVDAPPEVIHGKFILARFEGGANFQFQARTIGSGSIDVDIGHDGTIDHTLRPSPAGTYTTVDLPAASTTIVAFRPDRAAVQISDISFGASPSLVEILSFGNQALNLKSIGRLGGGTLVRVAPLPPSVQSLISTFRGHDLTGLDGLAIWNTSGVKVMDRTFKDANFDDRTSGIIAAWDVGMVFRFNGAFENSTISGDLSQWDVRRGSEFTNMFKVADRMTADLSGWCTHTVRFWQMPRGFAEGSTPGTAAALDAQGKIRSCP